MSAGGGSKESHHPPVPRGAQKAYCYSLCPGQALSRSASTGYAGSIVMLDRISFATIPIVLSAALTTGSAEAAGEAKYPDWKGQWVPVNAAGPGGHNAAFDQTKP